jgi:hypothetical protein
MDWSGLMMKSLLETKRTFGHCVLKKFIYLFIYKKLILFLYFLDRFDILVLKLILKN